MNVMVIHNLNTLITKDSNPFLIVLTIPDNPGCPGPSGLFRPVSWLSLGQGGGHKLEQNFEVGAFTV